ncbi:thiamine phosphate synthase [Sulfobacillus sp. hq2]|uniref:thiamine phosphate synthase n=1 Tax=Sulfobacillus TaxID=28033 RepID=UPI000CD17605|nr:thiamine phosphate synthase [Sulfobacillus sp. hq2]POB09526.1 thiamine phosphate synthase [Sulfobacillus sp. hq2]
MDLSLHVLVDPFALSEESLRSGVQAIALGGATVVQMRSKDRSTRELIDGGRMLKELCQKYGLAFIVNDRVDVALALGADGVHVGQDDMPVSMVRTLASQLTVGLSVSSLQEVLAAEASPPDYFGMGPVFATASKSDAGPAVGTSKLREWTRVAQAMAPVVAIGGISLENAGAVWQCGVNGIAVISAVWQAADKQEACRRLREH